MHKYMCPDLLVLIAWYTWQLKTRANNEMYHSLFHPMYDYVALQSGGSMNSLNLHAIRTRGHSSNNAFIRRITPSGLQWIDKTPMPPRYAWSSPELTGNVHFTQQ